MSEMGVQEGSEDTPLWCTCVSAYSRHQALNIQPHLVDFRPGSVLFKTSFEGKIVCNANFLKLSWFWQQPWSVCVCLSVHAGQKGYRLRMGGACHSERQRSLYRSAFTHLHTRPPSSYLSPSVLCSSTSVTLATERGREGKSNGGKGREARSRQLIVRPLGESERLRGRETKDQRKGEERE